MRADLGDALASVEWGESQLHSLGRMFANWKDLNIRISIKQPDPQSGKKVAVLRKKSPLPPIINAGVGSAINSFRAALDMLAAALARRNGVPASEDTHFRVYRSILDFIDPKDGMEAKKWLSSRDKSVLKSLRPYDGGNALLWSLHQLDILRKHERLVTVAVEPHRVIAISEKFPVLFRPVTSMEDETELFEFSGHVPDPEATFEVTILFDEISLPVHRKPVFPTLAEFHNATLDIVAMFDVP